MLLTLIALLGSAGGSIAAATSYGDTGPSFVSCNSVVACEYKYKVDPKVPNTIIRCKPRADTTQPCTTGYCCIPLPPTVPCNSAWANTPCAATGYKPDSVNGVLQCNPRQLLVGATNKCSTDFCCNPPPPPTSFITCDKAGIKCAYGYNPDPKVGGILRCKPRAGSTESCSVNFCCAPPPSFVSCADVQPCAIYQQDPKTGGVMRCKPRSTSTQACSFGYCCVAPVIY